MAATADGCNVDTELNRRLSFLMLDYWPTIWNTVMKKTRSGDAG